MDAYKVIQTVQMTEKTNALMEGEYDRVKGDKELPLKYTFIVHPEANKLQIKRAVKELFEREVSSVNVQNRQGKKKRTRFGIGKKADWKKAIVTLKPGQEPIELY